MIFRDLVKQSATYGGSVGVLNLGLAVSGYFRRVQDANIADGKYVPAMFFHSDGNQWQVGKALYDLTSVTLTMTAFIDDSSSGGGAVDFSIGGPHQIAIINPSEIIQKPWTTAYQTSSQSIANATTLPLAFHQSVGNGGFWDAGNPTRLSIPEWADSVSFSAGIVINSGGVGLLQFSIDLDNGSLNGVPMNQNGYENTANLSSGILETGSSLYAECKVWHDYGSAKSTKFNGRNYLTMIVHS